MKNNKKSKKIIANQGELKNRAEERLEKWRRMENGDIRALIELTVERGMATKEDFPEYFMTPNAQP